jgi:hypothetical protein
MDGCTSSCGAGIGNDAGVKSITRPISWTLSDMVRLDFVHGIVGSVLNPNVSVHRQVADMIKYSGFRVAMYNVTNSRCIKSICSGTDREPVTKSMHHRRFVICHD